MQPGGGDDDETEISHRPEAFFDLFTESAENLRTGAELLQDLIVDYRDVELKAQRVADREHEGDEVTHEIIRELNTSFVTPFDREDIHQLAAGAGRHPGRVEAVADMCVLHHIEEPLPEMRQQADVSSAPPSRRTAPWRGCADVAALEPYWVEINRLENEGDRIYRGAVGGCSPASARRWPS